MSNKDHCKPCGTPRGIKCWGHCVATNPEQQLKPMQNLTIIGDGVFGTFLKALLQPHFNVCDNAESVILAVPISAYDELGKKYSDRHLINVCSVQKPSTDTLLKYTKKVTSIHPLFGPRTPENKRNSILTHVSYVPDDTWFYDEGRQDFSADSRKFLLSSP